MVTTPQTAAAEVAERAGSIALQTRQRLAGVVENMSWMELPDGNRMEVFGSGGGQAVADSLSTALGAPVPLLGQVPLETRLRECGDERHPDRADRAGHRPRPPRCAASPIGSPCGPAVWPGAA